MSYDYTPKHGKPNPMSKAAFDAMTGRDRSNFMLLGGTLIDAATDAQETNAHDAEIIIGANGRTVTRREFHDMSLTQRSGFFLGHNGSSLNDNGGQS